MTLTASNLGHRPTRQRGSAGTVAGAVLFFLVAPGTVAGLVPRAITGWRVEGPFLGLPLTRVLGGLLVFVGLASLLESFARFVRRGRGTPAPVAPPTRLVVSGQYAYVRNPMYVAVLFIVLGQSVLLGSLALLGYATALWVLFHAWVILYEEPTLARQFGASFDEYRAHVRRWWPRYTAWSG